MNAIRALIAGEQQHFMLGSQAMLCMHVVSRTGMFEKYQTPAWEPCLEGCTFLKRITKRYPISEIK